MSYCELLELDGHAFRAAFERQPAVMEHVLGVMRAGNELKSRGMAALAAVKPTLRSMIAIGKAGLLTGAKGRPRATPRTPGAAGTPPGPPRAREGTGGGSPRPETDQPGPGASAAPRTPGGGGAGVSNQASHEADATPSAAGRGAAAAARYAAPRRAAGEDRAEAAAREERAAEEALMDALAAGGYVRLPGAVAGGTPGRVAPAPGPAAAARVSLSSVVEEEDTEHK